SSNPPSNNPASSYPPSHNPASSNPPSNDPGNSHPPLNNSNSPKQSEVTQLDEILANLPADHGLRPPMTYYNPNFQEQIRRALDALFAIHRIQFQATLDKLGFSSKT
ncbi:unnamed protein product, partial [Prunus brigantina]